MNMINSGVFHAAMENFFKDNKSPARTTTNNQQQQQHINVAASKQN